MAQFQYITQGGTPATFDAADSTAALAALPTNALPNSGVRLLETPAAPTKITPTQNADGAVSSSDVTTKMATQTATAGAANALTPPLPPPPTQVQGIDYAEQLKQRSSALAGSFDATLASQNQQYTELFKQLEGQHQNASQAGAALAAQLNPYSDPRIASTTQGYQQAIDQKYAAQAQSLRGQLNAAQAQLQANYQENYIKLVQDAQEKQQKFQMDMQNYGLQLYNSVKQAQQFDVSSKIQLQGQASDDFRSFLTTFSGSPQLQSDIEAFQSTGKITPGLMPIIEKGQQAGMSPTESLSIFQYQTDSLRKQEALEDYRTQQLLISQDRATAAANRSTNAQLSIATTQAVLQAQQNMRAAGTAPGTIDWAVGTAAATGASTKVLPMDAVSKYTQLGVVANQLGELESIISDIGKDNAVWNTVNTYAGKDVASIIGSKGVAELTARLNLIAPTIGRALGGQSGNLSDRDVAQVLSGMPTGSGSADLRTALFGNLLKLVKDNAVENLQNQSQSGYQTATYIDSVQRISNAVDQTLKKTTNPVADGLKSKYPGLQGLP